MSRKKKKTIPRWKKLLVAALGEAKLALRIFPFAFSYYSYTPACRQAGLTERLPAGIVVSKLSLDASSGSQRNVNAGFTKSDTCK